MENDSLHAGASGSAGEQLHRLINGPELVVAPGGSSPFTARLVELVGFKAFFLAGSQLSAHVLGVPNGMATITERVDIARRVSGAVRIPVIVDGDTGHGNAADAYRFVRELASTTHAAGVVIEDKVAPLRSRGETQQLISLAEAIGKYQAAVAARDDAGSSLQIFARCDVFAAGGTSEQAIERCIAYVLDGGADCAYIDRVPDLEFVGDACKRIPAPVLPVYLGPPPAPALGQWSEAGAAIVIYPAFANRIAVQAMWDGLNDLHERGAEVQEEWAERAAASRWGDAFRRLAEVPPIDRLFAAEKRFLPE